MDETVTLREHLEALRVADEKFQSERDRRYTEVNIEREKALKIKEEADKIALGLSRDSQIYKDEKANELREQISSERGHYASKEELAAAVDKFEILTRPLSEFVTGQQGKHTGGEDQRANISIAISLGLAAILVYRLVTGH